jgi:hypothetical protein
MKLLINGVDKISLLKQRSLRIQDTVNKRSTVSFSLVNENLDYHPSPGLPIEIYDNDNALVFAGLIDVPREISPIGVDVLYIPIEAVDNQAICDRRLVIDSYDNMSAGDIVKDILTKVLSDEGIIAGTIQQGPTLIRSVFPYVTATQALDDLAEVSGFTWWITHDKKLHFADRNTFKAPWNITSTSPIRDFEVEQNRDEYRNRQYIRAGQDVSDLQTESFKGDGKQQTFTVGLKIAKEPTLYLNGVQISSADVGIRGVESGKQWYWSKNEKEISQDQQATPLAETDVLKVDFYGFFPIVVVSERGDAISERQAAEGGTGIYEAIDQLAEIDDAEASLDIANGKLRRFGKFNKLVTFNTDEKGLAAGQLITIDLGIHGISNERFLIDSVEIEDLGRGYLRYRIHAVDGEAVGGWENFFKKLIRQGGTYTIRENEILVKLKTARDTVRAVDSFTIEKAAPESRIGYARIGFSEIA